MSDACKVILDQLGGYILKERGMTAIKGKGLMKTHWLIGKTQETTNYGVKIQNKSPSITLTTNRQCENGGVVVTMSKIDSDSSSSSSSTSIGHPSNSLRLNFSHSYEHNDFPSLMKLNNLGSPSLTISQSITSSNRYPLVNLTQNSTPSNNKKHDSCLFLSKEPNQKFISSSIKSGVASHLASNSY